MTIVIYVSDGNVQRIVSDLPDVKVFLVDEDNAHDCEPQEDAANSVFDVPEFGLAVIGEVAVDEDAEALAFVQDAVKRHEAAS